jgi:hypothetical protein
VPYVNLSATWYYCPVEAAVRERVAVVETLLLTVTRSVEKLAARRRLADQR